ncbi:MAG: hypothetical protein ABJC19_07535 [Gemmatimonadota bacterium]
MVAVPDLRLDGATLGLSDVSNLLVAKDGTIALVQRQDAKVRLFEASGRETGSFGAKGEGPGEFRAISLSGWVGDSLWVSDPATRRTTIISPDRKLAASLPMPITLGTGDPALPQLGTGFGLSFQGMAHDGTVSVWFPTVPKGPHPSWWPTDRSGTPVVSTTREGRFRKVLLWRPEEDRSCNVSWSAGGASGGTAVPFCAAPLLSFSDHGDRIALVTQQNGVPAFRVAVFDSDGLSVFARSISYQPVPIPRQVSDSVLEIVRRQPQPNAVATKAIRDMKLPAEFAPVRRVILGSDGSTWLERRLSVRSREWLVLNEKGNTVGTLTLDPDVTLRVVTRTMVWATVADADDVPSVIRMKVR